MATKRVRISADAGVTYYTFPGSSGEMANDAGQIADTILGQDYASGQSGLIGWTMKTNGLYKGFAGYVAKLKKGGTPTTFASEAATLVSGKTYKITDATKNVFDRTTPVVVRDGVTPISAANILSLDYLFGRVTFVPAYTVVGAITFFSGKYIPMATIGRANTFNLTQTAATVDDADFDATQTNSGHRIFKYGLKTVSLSLGGIFDTANAWRTLLDSRAELVIEINPDGSSKTVARGFFKPLTEGQSGNVGDQEAENISFTLSVPDQADVIYPFQWIIDATSTLNMSVQLAIVAWENKTIPLMQYLPDGTTGVVGSVVITDVSLSGGLEAMNEFTVSAQGTGILSTVP